MKYDTQSFVQTGVALAYQGVAVNVAFSDGRYHPSNYLIPTGAVNTVSTLIGAGYSGSAILRRRRARRHRSPSR